MKKGLLLSGMIGMAAVSALWLLNNDSDPRYVPASETGATPAIAGAVEYLNMLKANQITGMVDPEAEYNARRQARAISTKQALDLNWESLGPGNSGGRTRAILIDKDNSNIIYAGSVSGGLFRSSTGGSSWNPVSPVDENIAVVSICQASNGDIYYGTGEFPFIGYFGGGAASTPAFTGGGVFKSTDGGNTFTVLPVTVPNPNSTSGAWSAVGCMEAHPTDPNVIYAGTTSGLRRTTDGGVTWSSPLVSGLVRDFTIDVNGNLYVAAQNKLLFSSSGDAGTFTELTKVIPGATDLPESNGRMRIAVSPQDPNYVYVVQLAGDELKGVYRSTDAGANWTKIGTKGAQFDPMCSGSNCQGTYDLLFAVSPKDKNQIWLGGITLWTWDNGQWSQVNTTFASPGNPYYIHSDNHEMVFDPKNPDVIWIGNDGGLFRSVDHGETWMERNLDFRTLQFYGFGVGQDRSLIGGTQDNGTQLMSGKGSFGHYSERLVINGARADGGVAKISWLQPKVMFAENQNGDLGRSIDGGTTFLSFYDPQMTKGFKPFSGGFSNWILPYDLHETTEDSLSTDSVIFDATSALGSLGFGNGSQTEYSGVLKKPLDVAVFVTDSFTIVAGSLKLVSDAAGNLTGDGTGTFDPVTGAYSFTFNTPPPIIEIVVTCDVMYPAGTTIIAHSSIAGLPFKYQLSQALLPEDTIHIQDQVQSMMIVGLTSWNLAGGFANTGGIWMTRDAHDVSNAPIWWKIAQLPNGTTPLSIEISADGDVCYIGTTNGAVYRFANLNEARNDSADIEKAVNPVVEVDMIRAFPGRAVTGIAVDPNNNDRVLVTLGNYGNADYVFYSENATSASPTFVSRQGTLPAMPVYCATFDKANPNVVVIGTELGVFATENITAVGSVTWAEENAGMTQVPVFAIEQYRTNKGSVPGDTVYEGDIFIATHGRSFLRTTTLMTDRAISVRENEIPGIESEDFLHIFPNPSQGEIKVRVDVVGNEEVRTTVRDLNGRLMKMKAFNGIPSGTHDLILNLDDLKSGVYLISVQNGNNVRTGKLILQH